MKNNIGKFIANMHRKLFERCVEGEIYSQIFPHLNHEADHGYPFNSDEELETLGLTQARDAKTQLEVIERLTAKMPAAYGKAFRHIAYSDLNARMKKYADLAKRRVYPEIVSSRIIVGRD